MDKPVDCRQQLHAEWRLEPVDQARGVLERRQVVLSFGCKINGNAVLLRVIEPDHVERPGIGKSLVAMQVAAIERIEKVGQPRSLRSELDSLELQVERIREVECLDLAL